jgi:hypothetical protein
LGGLAKKKMDQKIGNNVGENGELTLRISITEYLLIFGMEKCSTIFALGTNIIIDIFELRLM